MAIFVTDAVFLFLSMKDYKDSMSSSCLECSFWKDIIFRPHWAFFKIYILQKGFLDGKIGFILSLYHYMYTVTKYVKLYYLNKSNGRL